MSAPFEPFGGFETHHVSISPTPEDPTLSLKIYLRRWVPRKTKTAVRPLLLIHGHPQTHIIWSRVAESLVQTAGWELVIPDIRGYGQSSAPGIETDTNFSTGAEAQGLRARYTKRSMARDLVEVMKSFGHESFHVVGHDRGGRIAHRMALDHPEAVRGLIVLDIAPTLDMYNFANQWFATYYWHWFFLTQPYPFPEKLLTGRESTYIDKMISLHPSRLDTDSSSDSIHPQHFLQAYKETLSNPASLHAMCHDYRASAPGGPDLLLDQDDRNRKHLLKCRLSALWGADGVVNKMYDGSDGRPTVLALWKACAYADVEVRGRSVSSGHYIPEELPNEVVVEIASFFRAH